MRVIKRGKSVVRRTQCRECEAELEFTLADVKKREGWATVTYITCPECGSEIVLQRLYSKPMPCKCYKEREKNEL